MVDVLNSEECYEWSIESLSKLEDKVEVREPPLRLFFLILNLVVGLVLPMNSTWTLGSIGDWRRLPHWWKVGDKLAIVLIILAANRLVI